MSTQETKKSKLEDQAVSNFREYLRIKTVQPDPDYDGAIEFLTRMAKELDLPYEVVNVHRNKPVFLITWEGTDPSLSSVLLNSHTDVVPVYLDQWIHEPFSAHKDEAGNIYARGSQDMKCVGNQYIEAVRRLKAEGKRFLRTIHFSFVPDEEIGGHLGMELFTQTSEFAKLNIGFSLDEGLANPTEAFTVYYGERCPWWVRVTCKGDPGHGSRFIENSAAEKFRKVVNSFLEFRDSEERKLKANPKLRLGDVTTCNMTIIEGGVQINVVPSDMIANFDIRITPETDFKKFEDQIRQWCENAGKDVTYEFLQKNTNKKMTSVSKKDPWWNAFSSVCESLNMSLELEIFPAATDSRFLRAIDIPAIGFSPMNKTPILLHDHNEFLNEDIFLKGIVYYMDIIPAMASVPAF